MKKTVPAYIITGFLGSGKTTVLQKILIYCQENKLMSAIVLNEIGELDLINDKLVGKVRKKVGEQKRSDTVVVETSYGKVNIEQLLERRISIHRTSSGLQLLNLV